MKKHVFVFVVAFLAFLLCIFAIISEKIHLPFIKKQTAELPPVKDDILSCTLSIEQEDEKQKGQIRLIVDIVNTGEENVAILEPKTGVNLVYMFHKKNTDSFYSLVLPGIYSVTPEVKQLSPNDIIQHESILGLAPGEYEIYAEYISHKSQTQSTWFGKIRSNLVSIYVR